MDCASADIGPDIYPGSLEFPACDLPGSASACLVCLSPVEEQLENHNKLLRHSGVPLLVRLQQLLPLTADESVSVCAACVSLVVGIDELELRLSEQHCQLQRRHVQKAEQHHWQQAAEQVICSAGQEGLEDSSGQQGVGDVGQGQQDGLLTEVPSDDQKTEECGEWKVGVLPTGGQGGEEGAQLKSEGCVEGVGQLGMQPSEQQDKFVCGAQEEEAKHAERPVKQPEEVHATTAADGMPDYNIVSGL